MIAELGLAALWLAAGFAALQAVSGFVPRLADLAAPAAWSHALLLALAMAAFLLVFWRVDLSVEAVIASADIGLPPPLRVAASWADPAGAALLAATLYALSVGAVAFFGTSADGLARLGGVALATDAVVLVLAPFARADPWPIAGNGLAPALQSLTVATVVPLLAAGTALTLVAVASWSLRWLWGAAAALAAALVTASWSAWLTIGDPTLPVGPAIAAVVVLLVAVVAGRGGRRAGTLVAFAGAVAVGVGAAGPVVRSVHMVPLAGLQPAAGPGWTAITARLRVGTHVLAPEWRTYAPTGLESTRAATSPDVLSTTAASFAAPPDSGSARIVATSAPLLPLVWAGGLVVVLGAALGVGRR